MDAGSRPPLKETASFSFSSSPTDRNAIRHCPQGTHIVLELHDEPDGFRAELIDDGPGIPAHEREKVFRRLYRLERARSTPGSGLGLTLVAAIAELHDARIDLDDHDPGLRVAITFRGAIAVKGRHLTNPRLRPEQRCGCISKGMGAPRQPRSRNDKPWNDPVQERFRGFAALAM